MSLLEGDKFDFLFFGTVLSYLGVLSPLLFSDGERDPLGFFFFFCKRSTSMFGERLLVDR